MIEERIWCDFCERYFDLEGYFDEIYHCEHCHKMFCEDCFVKAHGKTAFDEMKSHHAWHMKCPNCYPLYLPKRKTD